MENTMKIRTAIFAACASTLALVQTDVAWAHGTASESKSFVRIAVGPKPMIVAGGSKISENESPRPQNRVKARKGNAAGGFEKTFLDGNASFGLRILQPGKGGATGR
jgi:hypothetical protein